MVRALFPQGEFIEVFMETPLATCEARDPKGLYQKARSCQLPDFTGIDSPYEAPENPDLRLDTIRLSVNECLNRLIDHLIERALVTRKP